MLPALNVGTLRSKFKTTSGVCVHTYQMATTDVNTTLTLSSTVNTSLKKSIV